MKTLTITRSIFAFSVLMASLAVSSCGESTNLKDPSSASVVSSCSALGGTTNCVSGRLVDDLAYNIDYECGPDGGTKVRSVTDTDGSFSCPAGTTVIFSIINPDHNTDTDKKIVLGQTHVVAPAKLYGSATDAPTVYAYLTPRNLTGDAASTNSFSTATINLVRLLQTLNSDTVTDLASPARRIVIDDADKRLLTSLSKTIAMSDFSLPAGDPSTTGTFDALVQPYLQSLAAVSKQHLISTAQATAVLEKGVYSSAAGMFSTSGLPATTSSCSNYGGLAGGDTTTSSGCLIGTFYLMVDRLGRMLGSGVYSYEIGQSSQALSDNPKPFEFSSSGRITPDGSPAWLYNSSLVGGVFSLLDSNAVATTKTIRVEQGALDRQAIAGTADIYATLFGEESDSTQLGRWSLLDGAATVIAQDHTNLTLVRNLAATPTLDPDLWAGNTDNVASKLPLAVTAYFCNVDTTGTTSSQCNSSGHLLATVRFVILANGNVASDLNQHCGVGLDKATLKYGSPNAGQQEYPLGTVANIFAPSDAGASVTFMTLLFAIPNKPEYVAMSPLLPYSQLSTNLGGSALLRVDGNATTNTNFLKTYLYSSTDKTYTPDQASWLNNLTSQKFSQASKLEPNPSNPVHADTLLYLRNQNGYFITAPTPTASCI